MKPILFDKTATTFTSNGLGRLDCIECKVTEERNGIYELSMTITDTALHADQIEMSSIIVVKPYQGASLQAFRVYQITKPINGRFSVYAEHISYQLSMIPTMPFSIPASAQACANTLAGLKTNAAESCPFNFSTDVTTVSSYNQTTPSSIRSRLGGIQGSVLDQFGGEYEWDNYDVKLWSHRGVTTPNVTLRYGKNITDLNQEENIANTITGICPFWADNEGGNVVTLPEKTVDSSHASAYPFKRTVPKDFSQDFETEPTVAQLRTKAQAYVNNSDIGVPVVSIKLSFVNLADTEEYKSIAPLQSVKLCDLIKVEFEKYGISTTAKIVKTVYDVLLEKYESLEIGSMRTGLATTIAEQNADTVTTLSSKFKKVGDEIDNATAWLTSSGGYVVAVKNTDGSWKELLFLDDDDIESAVNVLRINENGIGFSSNGVDGPYTQAWTLDGRLVIGGTNVPSITVYDANSNIIFQASADAMIWNTSNSSMDQYGRITMNGASITNGTITMIGTTSWMQLLEGEIHGGRGTTVGQNETKIEFDTLCDNKAGNIRLQGTYLLLDSDNIGINDAKGGNTFALGLTGEVMTWFEPHSTELHYVTDMVIDFGTQHASWTNVWIDVVQYVNWGMTNYEKGIIVGSHS